MQHFVQVKADDLDQHCWNLQIAIEKIKKVISTPNHRLNQMEFILMCELYNLTCVKRCFCSMKVIHNVLNAKKT